MLLVCGESGTKYNLMSRDSFQCNKGIGRPLLIGRRQDCSLLLDQEVITIGLVTLPVSISIIVIEAGYEQINQIQTILTVSSFTQFVAGCSVRFECACYGGGRIDYKTSQEDNGNDLHTSIA